jgi:hypothetical protein
VEAAPREGVAEERERLHELRVGLYRRLAEPDLDVPEAVAAVGRLEQAPRPALVVEREERVPRSGAARGASACAARESTADHGMLLRPRAKSSQTTTARDVA